MPKNKSDPQNGFVQMWAHKWYPVGEQDFHICCDCGMEHRTRYKWSEGRLWENWSIIKNGTSEHLEKAIASRKRKKKRASRSSRR